MFVALFEGKPVTAGSDAPEFAKCIYCGARLKLVGPTISPSPYPAHVRWVNVDKAAYSYRHLTNEAAIECPGVCDGEKKADGK